MGISPRLGESLVTVQAVSRPSRTSLTRQCLESIRRYILDNRLGPGDRLPSQQEWAELLGVSTVVVREAFQALQALGLVEVQQGRGTFVCGLEGADFLDFLTLDPSQGKFTLPEVIEARAMLDLAVLEACIIRATPEAIEELEQILQQMRHDPPPLGMDSSTHKLFHQAMLKASGNRLLLNIGLPLFNTFWILGNTGRIQFTEEAKRADLVAIHEAYLDAIKRRDLSHTRELVDQHLLGLCSKYGVFPSFSARESLSLNRPRHDHQEALSQEEYEAICEEGGDHCSN